MTRLERIAKHKELGLDTSWLEVLTDEEYENQRELENERELKRARHSQPYGKESENETETD